MRFLGLSLTVCTVFVAGLASPAASTQAPYSQPLTPQGAAAPSLRMGRYDKSAEVVTSGTIVSIQAHRNATLPRGTYMVLRSGALTLNVHMGLFSAATIPFATGELVEVMGSLISMNGSQILLARQVQSAHQKLTVRSSNGFVVRPHPGERVQGLQP